jgi:hypothetical protein
LRAEFGEEIAKLVAHDWNQQAGTQERSRFRRPGHRPQPRR